MGAISATIVICPGFHEPALTAQFLRAVGWGDGALLWDDLSPLDGLGVARRLAAKATGAPVVFVGFSAGVVGAVGAACHWQQQGNRVMALIALDGWGVPLPMGTFPVYRLSHDWFTCISSGGVGFYCDPPIPHLELWRSPQRALGWQVLGPGWRARMTAANFLQAIVASPVR